MTSSNGNIFRITGPLCGEFTGHRDAELWHFLWSTPWINGWVNNREADDLRRHRAHYDVTVMKTSLKIESHLVRAASLSNILCLLHTCPFPSVSYTVIAHSSTFHLFKSKVKCNKLFMLSLQAYFCNPGRDICLDVSITPSFHFPNAMWYNQPFPLVHTFPRGRKATINPGLLHHDNVIKWKHFPRYCHLVRWIPRTNVSDAELWCFLWSSHE